MNRMTLPVVMAVTALTLGACGHRQSDRALSGAAIGAGAGAVGGAVLGGDPVTGALIGGAGGAAIGAFTDPKQLNLGRPAWR
jgi:osmotically inducible lipoprotein OsmB